MAMIKDLAQSFPDYEIGYSDHTKPDLNMFVLTTAYNYDEYLEELCDKEEFKDYCRYIDMKAQFDVEYNMPSEMTKVNARSTVLEKIGTNGVHPTMSGYLQIGDVFYRALVRDMNDESE